MTEEKSLEESLESFTNTLIDGIKLREDLLYECRENFGDGMMTQYLTLSLSEHKQMYTIVTGKNYDGDL